MAKETIQNISISELHDLTFMDECCMILSCNNIRVRYIESLGHCGTVFLR